MLIVALATGDVARAQDAPPDPVPAALDAAVANGLTFLARAQVGDGSIDGGGPKVAMTGLVVMSLLAAGHAPDVGQYGSVLRQAVDYLVTVAPADGYFGKLDGSRMYGHGIVTLALAEVAGVEPDASRRAKQVAVIGRAVDVILKAQDVPKGAADADGWRYEPQSVDSDLSLSGWNVLALRAAQNAGVAVPKERVERAVRYVLKCRQQGKDGFAYQPGKDPSVAMTGVAVLNLYLLDAHARPEVAGGVAFLTKHLPDEDQRFYYYAAYYATQAAHQAGGDAWPAVARPTLERLLAIQMPDGGWPQSKTGEEPGRVYSTGMAVLTLTVPYKLLPIYQR